MVFFFFCWLFFTVPSSSSSAFFCHYCLIKIQPKKPVGQAKKMLKKKSERAQSMQIFFFFWTIQLNWLNQNFLSLFFFLFSILWFLLFCSFHCKILSMSNQWKEKKKKLRTTILFEKQSITVFFYFSSYPIYSFFIPKKPLFKKKKSDKKN